MLLLAAISQGCDAAAAPGVDAAPASAEALPFLLAWNRLLPPGGDQPHSSAGPDGSASEADSDGAGAGSEDDGC
jgi:hypothetical protein